MIDHMTPAQAIAYLRAWSRTAEQIAYGLADYQTWEALQMFRWMDGVFWLTAFSERDLDHIVPNRQPRRFR